MTLIFIILLNIFSIICAIVALVASYSALKHSFPQEAYDRWQDLRRQMEELGEKRQDVATLAEQHHAAAPRP